MASSMSHVTIRNRSIVAHITCGLAYHIISYHIICNTISYYIIISINLCIVFCPSLVLYEFESQIIGIMYYHMYAEEERGKLCTQSCKANDWVNQYYSTIQYLLLARWCGRLQPDTMIQYLL